MATNIDSRPLTHHREPRLRRVVVAGVFGTALEAYDLYLYGTAAALVFPALFFPNSDPGTATLLALSTFAVSFVARPIGAVVFGHVGDRLGRRKTLFITLILMGVSTFLIGVLPGYALIGVAAPIALTILRFAQGFGYGGEYTGGVLMLVEHAPPGRRGFYGGLINAAPVAGYLGSTLLFLMMNALLPREQFLMWGWRVPFLVSILLVGVGLYVRRRVAESPMFLAVERTTSGRRAPLIEAVVHHRREVIIAAGANISQFATFYLIATFALGYATTQMGFDPLLVLSALIIAVATNAVTIPASAALSDRLGRRPVLALGSAAMLAWAFPFFALLDSGEYPQMLIAFIGGMASYGMMYGPLAAFTSELFPTAVRYTGAAVGYNLGGIVGGAVAPLLAAFLYSTFKSTIPISLYLALVALVSFVFVMRAPETSGATLANDSDLSEVTKFSDRPQSPNVV